MTPKLDTFYARRELIKSRLRIIGSSFTKIARSLEVSVSSVSLVASGKHRSKRIEEAICQALGEQPEDIWPEKYSEDNDMNN